MGGQVDVLGGYPSGRSELAVDSKSGILRTGTA